MRSRFPRTELAKMEIGSLTWTLRIPVPDGLADCLANPNAALAQPDQRIKNSRVVTLARIQSHSGQRYILRRINYGKLRHRLRDLFRPSRAYRAFESAFLLDQAGVPTARAYGVSEKRWFRVPIAACLVTEEIPNSRNLAQYLAAGKVSFRAVRATANLIARLHAAGYSHRDLKLGNILLDQNLDAHLIDLDGLRYVKRVTPDRAAKDLARLWEGASGYQLGRMTMGRFLAWYGRQRGSQHDLRGLAERIGGTTSANRGANVGAGNRPMISRLFAGTQASLAGPEDDWIRLPGSGAGFVRKHWQNAFAQAGLTAADHFLTVAGAALSKPGLGKRYRARLDVEIAGEPRRVYLKRYAGERASARWKRWMEDGQRGPPAVREARVAAALANAKIEVPLPLVLGWDFARTARQRSFIVSTEAPGESAENWAKRIHLTRSPEVFRQKKRVATEIGLLARRFHEQGWCHRDFYLCHIFVHLEGEQVRLSLIDLQRVFQPRWRKWRWRIKDLAQLNYSAEQQGISRTLRLRFAKIYFAADRLGPGHRRRIRQILRKSRWISRHDRSRTAPK